MGDALPPPAVFDGEDEYYSAVRSVLLTALVLLATHISALVYTRRSTPDDEVRGSARKRAGAPQLQAIPLKLEPWRSPGSTAPPCTCRVATACRCCSARSPTG